MGPLDGIKVVDLSTMVSGPVAAMMLADQGAEVIKVEPSHGEQMRHLGVPYNGVGAINPWRSTSRPRPGSRYSGSSSRARMC